MKYLLVMLFVLGGCCNTKTIYYNSKEDKCDSSKCVKCIDIRTLK